MDFSWSEITESPAFVCLSILIICLDRHLKNIKMFLWEWYFYMFLPLATWTKLPRFLLCTDIPGKTVLILRPDLTYFKS